MGEILELYGVLAVAAAFGVLLFAGFVKGAVGFALPMITVSGISAFMSADVAIAAILLPGLITNIQQAFRQGASAAWLTLTTYWRLNLMLVVLIGIFAQLVVRMPDRLFFTILGTMITSVTILNLAGWRPVVPRRLTARVEWLTGTLAGIFGGLAGVWGPPILFYLLARDTPKLDMVRAQGIAFLLGSVVLLAAHGVSGLLTPAKAGFSAWLILPAVAGMLLGMAVQDRLNQTVFRRATLVVLGIAGLNLLRRGLFG